MKPEEIQYRIFSTFQLVNDWLKYAEIKNGVLLTLNMAIIASAQQFKSIYSPDEQLFLCWIWSVTIGCFFSLSITLSSFYSRTKIFGFEFNKNKNKNKNILFFGDLASFNQKDLLEKYDPNNCLEKDLYILGLLDQIIINSKITNRKYRLFNLAFWCIISGIFTPIGALLYYWLLCDETL